MTSRGAPTVTSENKDDTDDEGGWEISHRSKNASSSSNAERNSSNNRGNSNSARNSSNPPARSNIRTRIAVDGSFIGACIGVKGAVQRKFSEESGAKIHIQARTEPNAPDQEDHERLIIVLGSSEQVDKAIGFIRDVCLDYYFQKRKKGSGSDGEGGPREYDEKTIVRHLGSSSVRASYDDDGGVRRSGEQSASSRNPQPPPPAVAPSTTTTTPSPKAASSSSSSSAAAAAPANAAGDVTAIVTTTNTPPHNNNNNNNNISTSAAAVVKTSSSTTTATQQQQQLGNNNATRQMAGELDPKRKPREKLESMVEKMSACDTIDALIALVLDPQHGRDFEIPQAVAFAMVRFGLLWSKKLLTRSANESVKEAFTLLFRFVSNRVFTTVQVAYVWYGCALGGLLELTPQPAESMAALDGLKKFIIFEEMDIRTSAVLAWSTAKLGAANAPLFELIAHRIESKGFEGYTPMDLSVTAVSFAMLGMNDGRVFAQLAEEVCSRGLMDFHSSDITNVAWAFASLSIGNMPVFDAIFDELTSRALTDVNPSDIASIAWCFARVQAGRRGDTHFFSWLARSVLALHQRSDLQIFSPTDIANLLWAFATNVSVKTPETDAAFAAFGDHLKTRGFQNFFSFQIALVAWSFATLQYRLSAQMTEAIAKELAARGGLDKFPSQALVNLAWAFAFQFTHVSSSSVEPGHHHHHHHPAHPPFLHLSPTIGDDPQKATPADVMGLVLAPVATPGPSPESEMDHIRKIFELIVREVRIKGLLWLEARQIVMLAWSFARCSDSRLAPFLESYIVDSAGAVLQLFDSPSLSKLFWCLGKLGSKNKDAGVLVLNEIKRRGFDGLSVTEVAFALAAIKVSDQVMLAAISQAFVTNPNNTAQDCVVVLWYLSTFAYLDFRALSFLVARACGDLPAFFNPHENIVALFRFLAALNVTDKALVDSVAKFTADNPAALAAFSPAQLASMAWSISIMGNTGGPAAASLVSGIAVEAARLGAGQFDPNDVALLCYSFIRTDTITLPAVMTFFATLAKPAGDLPHISPSPINTWDFLNLSVARAVDFTAVGLPNVNSKKA